MGQMVYDCGNLGETGAHVYCHSRRDGKQGSAYLVINHSLTDDIEVELSQNAEIYVLDGISMRAGTMRLNGKELKLDKNGNLPALVPKKQAAGNLLRKKGHVENTCPYFVR